LIESGFFEDETQFNVFGGQSLSPPRYGRVFITSNTAPSDTTINEFINYLKERSVITVLPEYVQSNSLNVYVDFNFRIQNTSLNRSTTVANVKNEFAQNYAATNQYNVTFSSSDFIEYIQQKLNNGLIISPDDFNIYVRQQITSGKDYAFNLENELYLPLYTYIDITEPFDCGISDFPEGSKGVLKMYATSLIGKNNKINLQLWARDESTGAEEQIDGDFGYFIANSGAIYIKNGTIQNTAIMNVDFKKKNFTIGLNNLITFESNNVNVI